MRPDVKTIRDSELTNSLLKDAIYVLKAHNFSRQYYHERTDRNIGWITKEEQELLHQSTVGIAGCGGMGGLVAATLVRLGVGTIKIADCEDFDVSNINRQLGATKETVLTSKALSTAKTLRTITDDTELIIYPQGITEDTVEHFLDGCDIVCDEIEFWAIGSRILLHQHARPLCVPLLTCDTVGYRTYLFNFTTDSMKVEEALDIDYINAKSLQEKVQGRTAKNEEVQIIMNKMIRVFIPEIPEYGTGNFSTKEFFLQRLLQDGGKASIIATNPPMASGFVSNHVLFHLLSKSPVSRKSRPIIPMPGYIAFDAYLMETWKQYGIWWNEITESH